MTDAATPREAVTERVANAREALRLLADYLDPDALESRVSELEAEMQQPGFWDDQATAKRVSAEHAGAGRRLGEEVRRVEPALAGTLAALGRHVCAVGAVRHGDRGEW